MTCAHGNCEKNEEAGVWRIYQKSFKVPLWWWLVVIKKGKKKFVTHTHWLCTLPHTIYCSGGEKEKKKKKSCLKCLITTSPLTEWTICKVFLSANSSSCHISTSFPASLALAIDFSRKADRGWINKRALIAVDKPCPTVMCKLPYPCLPSLVVIEYVLLS